MSRVLGRPASGFDSVGDYEATVAPMFAWRDAVARDGPTGAALNGGATVTAWNALRADRNGRSAYQDLGALAARASDRRRLHARRRRAQPRWYRAAARRPLRCRAAPRRPAGDGRGGGAARPRRCIRRLRSHPSCGTASRGRRARVARARRRAPGERRQLDLRARSSSRGARREPVLAGRLRARRGRRSAAAACACCRTARTPNFAPLAHAEASPGVKQVARQRTPAPTRARARRPCGARARPADTRRGG